MRCFIVRPMSAPRQDARGHWDRGQTWPLIEPYLENPIMTWPFSKRLLDAREIPQFPEGETRAEKRELCRSGEHSAAFGTPGLRSPPQSSQTLYSTHAPQATLGMTHLGAQSWVQRMR